MTMQRAAALTRDPRVRFLVVGVASTLVHLAVLTALLHLVMPEAANAVAFLVATQANFAASYAWTWRSRRSPGRESVGAVLGRLALFHVSALVAFCVNGAAFAAAHRLLDAPPLLSALLATAVSCLVSFAVTSRLVFAHQGGAGAVVVAGSSGSAERVAEPVAEPVASTAAPVVLVLTVPAPRTPEGAAEPVLEPIDLRTAGPDLPAQPGAAALAVPALG